MGIYPFTRVLRSLTEQTELIVSDDNKLHNKTPPTPCLWKAPASAQKTKRKTRSAIDHHSPERTVEGQGLRAKKLLLIGTS